jgi:hypothetical protein
MGGENYGIIELSLVFGAVLAWAFWELWSLRKGGGGDDPSA